MPTARARFFVRERTLESSSVHPMYREYAEGVVSAAVPLVPDLAETANVWIGGIEPTGAHFAYCVSDEGMDRECFVRELAAFPDGVPQSLGIDPVPTQAVSSTPEWIAEWGAYYFTAFTSMPAFENGVYRAAVTDGVLETPEVLVASIGDAAPGDPELSADRAWISFIARTEVDGPSEVYVIAADGADPTAWIEVSDMIDPAENTSVATHLHGSQALVYAVDDTVSGLDGNAAFYLVDLGELPLVGSPARVDAPGVELRVRGVDVAPDDHALVYWTGGGDATFGELMLVELDGLVPQLPMRISTAADDEVLRVDYDWSPDSRWVVYLGAPDVESDWNVYFVDLAGATPADPVPATEPMVEPPEPIGFDAQSRWFYFITDVGDGESMFRVDVSGAEPSAPQVVAAPPSPADGLSGEAIWSGSAAEIMYTVYVDAPQMVQLWIVDVSGEVPGTATRVDTLRGGDGVQFGAKFSPDDALISFSEKSVEFGGPEPLRLVDRSAPDEALLISDNANNVVFLPD
jgi:hypothetical protein